LRPEARSPQLSFATRELPSGRRSANGTRSRVQFAGPIGAAQAISYDVAAVANVVVANVKGGVGKTTTAVYLAAVAVERGHDPVLLVDADRQASSAEWLEERPLVGVNVVEAPSERTLARAIGRRNGLAIVDTPPGDPRLLESAVAVADAVVIPTRAGGIEYAPALRTLEQVPSGTRRGIVICAARLGTNDLEETIAWWTGEKIPIWGVIPERVGIAAGPEARLYRQGLYEYDGVLRRALRGRR
jgi:chromosome partitioning protein